MSIRFGRGAVPGAFDALDPLEKIAAILRMAAAAQDAGAQIVASTSITVTIRGVEYETLTGPLGRDTTDDAEAEMWRRLDTGELVAARDVMEPYETEGRE